MCPEQQGRRSVALDVLKGLAILLVVFQHNYYVPFQIAEQPGLWSHVHYFLRAFMSLHVTTFFLVNGALLFARPMKLKRHLLKTVTLLLTMYLWAFLTLVLLSVTRGKGFPNMAATLAHVWNWDSSALTHFWFLRTLVLIYVAFPVVKVLWDRFRPGFLLLFGAMVLIVFGNTLLSMAVNVYKVLRGSVPYAGWFNYLSILNPLRSIHGVALTYFMLGGILWENRQRLDRRPLRICAAVALPLCCLLLFFYGSVISHLTGTTWDIIFQGYSTVFALIGVISLFILALGLEHRASNIVIRGLTLVGTNTLGIYYLHVVFGGDFAPLYQQLPAFNTLPVNVVYALVIALLSLVTTLLLKKVPIVRKIME